MMNYKLGGAFLHKHRSMILHYLIRGGILLGFTLYILYLVKIGKLQYYIVPRMIPYLKYTAIALYTLSIYYFYLALREKGQKHQHDHGCGCNHEPSRSVIKSSFLYSLFIFPLLLGFVLPDKIMGSDVAAVKGMNLYVSSVQAIESPISYSINPTIEQTVEGLSIPDKEPNTVTDPDIDLDIDTNENFQGQSNSQQKEVGPEYITVTNEQENFDVLFPSDAYSVELAELGKKIYTRDTIEVKEEGFLELLTLLDMYRINFIGKTINISGFVYREDEMDSDNFVVSRMAMQCCSADASPYGFLVQSNLANQYQKDTWVKIVGTLGLKTYQENEIIELKAQKITKMDAPDDPYVYPYFGDLIELAK